jgi:hypothetical protein
MSATEHKRVFRRLIDDGFNRGRLAVLDELLAADFVDHSPCRPMGCAADLRERVALLRFALPDLHLRVDDMAAAGDMTWAAVTVRGTGRAAYRVLERDRRSHGAAGDHRYLTDS